MSGAAASVGVINSYWEQPHARNWSHVVFPRALEKHDEVLVKLLYDSEKAEAQRGEAPSQRSHSKLEAKQGFEPT